jgi:tellurite resistance protein
VNANMAKCLVVSKVLVADGIMTDDERGFLAAMMGRLGLTPDEQRSVIELEGLEEADRIVAALSVDERREVVALPVDAASADGKLSPHELAAVKRVTAALGL